MISGCSANATPAATTESATYGDLPTFLPSDSGNADRMLTGSAARPALTTEGDTVHAILGDASVQIEISGPDVPGEGLPEVTAATTCTWTVTLTGATRSIPLRLTDFSTADHLGGTYHLTAGPNLPAPPATVDPGHTVTFALRGVMPTGEGLMRWAPNAGPTVASWDFEVEDD